MRRTAHFAMWVVASAAALCAARPLPAQISAASLPLQPPMWETDPTVTGTNDWDDWKRNCSEMMHDFGKGTFLSCATSTFRSRPFHFVAQTVVPGSAVGGGGYYGRDLNSDIWQSKVELTGVGTIRDFWFAEAKFAARRPHFGAFHSDENFAVQIYARDKQMPTLPFYGLGPNTDVKSSVRFSQRDTRLGVLVASPLASWLGVSGTFESLWPNVGGVTGANVVSIQQVYNEQTAPGLARQANFLHYEAFLRPHFSLASNRFVIDYRFRYGFFQDTSGGHYSFRRFTSDFGHTFYPETENGHRRLDSILTARFRISMSNTGAAQAVPFYLQETVGGSDIDNQPTLRAFRDYRFRGPNSFLVQTEFDRRIIGPIGLLLFYDAGKVTFARSDLNFSNLRQGFGGGLYPSFLQAKSFFERTSAWEAARAHTPTLASPTSSNRARLVRRSLILP
jgi:hypothetical protein